MKEKVKKIIFTIGISLMLISCGTLRKQTETTDITLGASMRLECNIQNGTTYQVDSIISADSLPNLDKWLQSVYTDYETEEKVLKRMYIRQFKNGEETVYIITGFQEPYKISKRITE